MPTDPLIYRFYELVNVYGTTLKELIHEEFGRPKPGSRLPAAATQDECVALASPHGLVLG